MKLFNFRFRITPSLAKERFKLFPRHREAVMVTEVFHVQPETPVFLEVDNILHDKIIEPWFTVRCKAHDLIFRAIDTKSQIICERRVKKPDRVWKPDGLYETNIVPAPNTHSSRFPFTDSIQCEYRRLIERRHKKCTGCMGYMMI